MSTYVDISSTFCNKPFNQFCEKGAMVTIDGSSRWNGQTMLRTELIPSPQPTAAGRRIYRFSIKNVNLNPAYENRFVFFESQLIWIVYGKPNNQAAGDVADNFQFWINGKFYWAVPAENNWHNFAIDIDHSAG